MFAVDWCRGPSPEGSYPGQVRKRRQPLLCQRSALGWWRHWPRTNTQCPRPQYQCLTQCACTAHQIWSLPNVNKDDIVSNTEPSVEDRMKVDKGNCAKFCLVIYRNVICRTAIFLYRCFTPVSLDLRMQWSHYYWTCSPVAITGTIITVIYNETCL